MTTLTGSITPNQLNFLLDLAWKKCDATVDELADYTVRFQTMTKQQASDLLEEWTKLPTTRNSSRPILAVAAYGAVPAPIANFVCSKCGTFFTTADIRDHHTRTAHSDQSYAIPDKGYYAVEVPVNGAMTMRFYRVTQRRPPNDKHLTFLRQSGDNWVGIDPTERKLSAAIICAAPILAMEAYGKLIGHCGCCGHSLTDPESRARGIGPECIKMYPDRQ